MVSVSCVWADDDHVRVRCLVDADVVIDRYLCGTCKGALDSLRSLLWDHRFDILARLRAVGASGQSLAPWLASYGAYRGLSVM